MKLNKENKKLNWQQQIKENGNFCMMPFVHFYKGTRGEVNLCCSAENSPKEWLEHIDISKIWTDETYQTLRQMFVNGERSDHCRRCWEADDRGGGSDRQTFNNWFVNNAPEGFEIDIQKGNNQGIPFFLDLRPGNFCNFSCRMCFVGISSKVNDYHREFPELVKVTGETQIDNKDWINIEENFEYIKKLMPDVTWLKIAGGEPLFMPGVIKLLKWCVDNGHVNMNLDITTNGSRSQGKILRWMQDFNDVNIQISIDGIGATQEYIRQESKWEQIDNSYRKYLDMGFKTNILTTVQLNNAYDLINVVHYWKQNGSQHVICFNFVEWPREYKIDLLPHDDRLNIADQIEEEFKDFSLEKKLKFRVIPLIDRLRNPEDISNIHRQKFVERTRMMDKIYNKNVNMLHPRIKELCEAWQE